MIKVNARLYERASELLAEGRWRIDPARGVLRADSDRIAGTLNTCGYLRLQFSMDGKQQGAMAHRVMWEAINGPIPVGYYINHLDGDKTNNAIANLECVTHRDNMIHAHATGLMSPVRAGRLTAKTDLVVAVFRDAHSGMSARQVAERHGVSQGWVEAIKGRQLGRRITEGIEVPNARDARTRFPAEVINEVRRRRLAGETAASLAAEFSMSPTYVKMLARGEWRKADLT